MSERPDDFDLSVAPLDAPPDDLTASRTTADPGMRRRTASQRALKIGSIIALMSMVASLLFLSQSGSRASLLSLLDRLTPRPTPAPTFFPRGDDAFMWEHMVPWGQLLIDGKAGRDVRGWAMEAVVSLDPRGAGFHLTRGRHALEYRAEPFSTLTCAVSVPPSATDTCPLTPLPSIPPEWNVKPKTRVLDLQATMDR